MEGFNATPAIGLEINDSDFIKAFPALIKRRIAFQGKLSQEKLNFVEINKITTERRRLLVISYRENPAAVAIDNVEMVVYIIRLNHIKCSIQIAFFKDTLTQLILTELQETFRTGTLTLVGGELDKAEIKTYLTGRQDKIRNRAIVENAKKENPTASNKELAQKTGLGEKTVSKHLRELQDNHT